MTISGTLFVVGLCVALLMALLKKPIVGLYAYVAVFYIHPPSRWWGASLPELRWSLIAAGVTLLAIWIREPAEPARKSWLATTPARIMIAFTVWFWLGTLWALDVEQHYPMAVLITKYLLVYYMIYRLVDTPQKMTTFLLCHVAGCFFLGVIAYGAPGGDRLDGVGGPGIDDSNTLGMHLGTGVVVAAIFTLRLKGWRRWLCVGSIVFALNAIVLTGSRGAGLALAAGGVALAMLKPIAYKRLFYAYAVLGILVIGYLASAQFWIRMKTVTVAVSDTPEEMDTSARSRIEMIKAQMEMAALYPLGSGHRGSEVLSPRFLDKVYMTSAGVRSSHNSFMTIVVEQGIPGVILFFVMVRWTASTLRSLRRAASEPGRVEEAVNTAAIGAGLVVVMIGGMFADFSKCEVQIWLLALLASMAERQRFSTPAAVGRLAANGAKPTALPAGRNR